MLISVAEAEDTEEHFVRVEETHVGKGVFATRAYPQTAIIGEIKGDLVHASDGSTEYTFDFENGLQIEPSPPFKFLNHSCDPNCEFDILEEPTTEHRESRRALFLIALRDIRSDEELTISYNWPADCAIECHCQSENCVGWIVCESEIDQIIDRYDDEFEAEFEFHDIGYYFPD